jgi:hypothetical protein
MKEKIIDFFIGMDLYATDFMDPIFKNGKLVDWEYRGPMISTIDDWIKETTLYRI